MTDTLILAALNDHERRIPNDATDAEIELLSSKGLIVRSGDNWVLKWGTAADRPIGGAR